MSACPDRFMSLQALLDGELDAANALVCEAHLKTCEACHGEFQRLRAVRDVVQSAHPAYRAPDSLRARIEASLDAAPSPGSRKASRTIKPWTAAAASGLLAAGLALVLVLPQFEQARLERELVASHVRSLLANHLTDVATTNEHLVRPWFNGKVDFAPPVPELADQGFPLAGGRLDYIGGRVVPAIVYHRRLHTVNLFVWPAGANGFPRGKAARLDGYSLVEWTQGGLSLSAVSDIDMAELKQFQKAFSARSPR